MKSESLVRLTIILAVVGSMVACADPYQKKIAPAKPITGGAGKGGTASGGEADKGSSTQAQELQKESKVEEQNTEQKTEQTAEVRTTNPGQSLTAESAEKLLLGLKGRDGELLFSEANSDLVKNLTKQLTSANSLITLEKFNGVYSLALGMQNEQGQPLLAMNSKDLSGLQEIIEVVTLPTSLEQITDVFKFIELQKDLELDGQGRLQLVGLLYTKPMGELQELQQKALAIRLSGKDEAVLTRLEAIEAALNSMEKKEFSMERLQSTINEYYQAETSKGEVNRMQLVNESLKALGASSELAQAMDQLQTATLSRQQQKEAKKTEEVKDITAQAAKIVEGAKAPLQELKEALQSFIKPKKTEHEPVIPASSAPEAPKHQPNLRAPEVQAPKARTQEIIRPERVQVEPKYETREPKITLKMPEEQAPIIAKRELKLPSVAGGYAVRQVAEPGIKTLSPKMQAPSLEQRLSYEKYDAQPKGQAQKIAQPARQQIQLIQAQSKPAIQTGLLTPKLAEAPSLAGPQAPKAVNAQQEKKKSH